MTSGFKNIGVRKSEFAAKTQFRCLILCVLHVYQYMNTIGFIRAFAYKYYFFTVTGLGHRLINTFDSQIKMFQVLKKYANCKYLAINCPNLCLPNIPSRSLDGGRLHSISILGPINVF